LIFDLRMDVHDSPGTTAYETKELGHIKHTHSHSHKRNLQLH